MKDKQYLKSSVVLHCIFLVVPLFYVANANADKPNAPNGVGSLIEYENRIGESGLLLESDTIQMWVSQSYQEHSQVIFEYLNNGYDSLSDIFGGHDLSVRFSIEHYPPGSPYYWGGTDAQGTIRYDYSNLEDDTPEWNNYGVPHVIGYYEEMAHCFIRDCGSINFYEALGMMIGDEVTLRIAWNPHVQGLSETNYQIFSETTQYYLEHNQGPLGVPNNIWPTRVLAHIFKKEVVDEFGWQAISDAFGDMVNEAYPLRDFDSSHKYGATLDYLPEPTTCTIHQVFAEYGLPLLMWTGETGYEEDGSEPVYGDTSYQFRVKCVDREGVTPVDLRLFLYDYTGFVGHSPYELSLVSGDPINGWIYEATAEISKPEWVRYAFAAKDGAHQVFQAVGAPTVPRFITEPPSYPPVIMWKIGYSDNSNNEFDTVPHDDPQVIHYSIVEPFSVFPSGLGTDIGNQRSVINIHFSGGYPEGGTLTLRWTAGLSAATERFSVTVNGQYIGESSNGGGSVSYIWDTEYFNIPGAASGDHVITLTHLTGDGLHLDHLAFSYPQPLTRVSNELWVRYY